MAFPGLAGRHLKTLHVNYLWVLPGLAGRNGLRGVRAWHVLRHRLASVHRLRTW